MTLELIIKPRVKDLGGLSVRRSLPHHQKRMVGPFIFLDEMGPASFSPGKGIDVRPHPHVCLSTVTYLFEGSIRHQDSTGAVQDIRPGDVNWMTAGSGIVHSERTDPRTRAAGHRLHGLQAWVALPDAHEETTPSFQHRSVSTLPVIQTDDAYVRVIAGSAGVDHTRAPIETLAELFYLHATLEPDGRYRIPDHVSERAAYVVEGVVEIDGARLESGQLGVLAEGAPGEITARSVATVMLLGGEPVGRRFIWWNFVASSEERIAKARRDWRESAEDDWLTTPFQLPEADHDEFIPLPEEWTGPVDSTPDCPTS